MGYKYSHIMDCVSCGKGKPVGRGLCRSCYSSAWNSGTLNTFRHIGPEDVFESRIQKTSKCWLWTGYKNSDGYGIFLLPGEARVRAHRYAYEHFVGPIPEGKIIMHTCDNPPCVNPAHLRVGTKEENNKDTGHKRRHNYGLDHWNGRLSDLDVLFIRSSAEKNSILAKRFGVDPSHISRIKRGESRK